MTRNEHHFEIERSGDVLDCRKPRVHRGTFEIRYLPLTNSQFASEFLLAEVAVQPCSSKYLGQRRVTITYRG